MVKFHEIGNHVILCNFKFLNTSDFCKLKSARPLWNLAMREPWAVFLSHVFWHCNANSSINFTTFKHFLLRHRPNRRRHESTWPSRPWLRSSRWSGWRYQEPKSPARHWTPGTAGHRWRWRKENIGNTGPSCNRSMYVKGKNMKTEKHMKNYERLWKRVQFVVGSGQEKACKRRNGSQLWKMVESVESVRLCQWQGLQRHSLHGLHGLRITAGLSILNRKYQ